MDSDVNSAVSGKADDVVSGDGGDGGDVVSGDGVVSGDVVMMGVMKLLIMKIWLLVMMIILTTM